VSRREAKRIARRLKSAGHEVVFAGGAVRDRLLGQRGADVDIATSASAEQIEGLFARTVLVGAAFGVVKVVWEGQTYDVATYRQDIGSPDGRHPERVEPATLEIDVHRRDFTINGLVEDPWTREITDLVGGREDLRAGLVRAIGDPTRRFREDGLRLLRAVRFAARFEFEIENSTLLAMQAEAPRLRSISGERVRQELERMLVDGHRRRAMELLDQTGLLEIVLPEIVAMHGVEQPPEFHPEGDVWVHTCLALEGLPARPSFELALGMLLHDVGKPPTFRRAVDRIRFDGHVELGAEMAEEICRRLRLSRASTTRVVALVRDHLIFKDVPQMRPARLRRLMAEPHFDELMVLYKADCMACHGLLIALPAIREMRHRLAEEALIPPPFLTGKDVLALGVEAGPHVGVLLREVADMQLEERLTSRAEALAWLSERVKSAETP
jgi:poly(A) polymerase